MFSGQPLARAIALGLAAATGAALPSCCSGGGSQPGGGAADDTMEAAGEAAKLLKFESESGESLAYVSHRPLEPERQRIAAAAFPQCGTATQVLAVVAKGPSETIEFLYSVKESGGGPPELEPIMGSCQITFEDLSPSSCVEYSFAEAPDDWALAQISLEALGTYRASKFTAWRNMLLKPECEAQFRRMLQIGVINRLFDHTLFPTPDSLISHYEVVDDRNGKKIRLPHPVSNLRIWNASGKRYDAIDAQLEGAPTDAEKAAWWTNMLSEFREQQGEEYINGLIAGTA